MEDSISSSVITDNSAPVGRAHHLPIEFTGSGSEYFRIWIVNFAVITLDERKCSASTLSNDSRVCHSCHRLSDCKVTTY